MSTRDVLRVAVIGGDGTGPEVTAEAVKVLKAVAALEGIRYELVDFDLGGAHYLRTGEVLPPASSTSSARFQAILLGAVGHPDVHRASWKRACSWSCASASTSTSTSAP